MHEKLHFGKFQGEKDDDYPSWPVSKYQGILDRLKELAQEYEEWLVKYQRSQRQNNMWHQGGHPRDFSGHFSNQRRHSNEMPRFRSAFEQSDFESFSEARLDQ